MFVGKERLFRALRAFCTGAATIWLSSCASQPVNSAAAKDASLREQTLLDADWHFSLGDVASSNDVIAAGYDDSRWKLVQVPHDYVLDASGDYSPTNARNHGYLPVSPAWYRKHFDIPQSDSGKTLQLEFDGVFRDSRVWLNGHLLGTHASGYTPFEFDVTRIARLGAENVITLRVDSTQFEGWWYEGGGIYRHVHFNAMDPLHVTSGGTYVVSKVANGDQGGDDEAEITIETTVQNLETTPVECGILSQVLGPDRKPLGSVTNVETVAAGQARTMIQHLEVQHPRLWSIDSPELYQLRTTILRDGHPVDSAMATFGIRTIRYDADKGFFLNGHHVEIRGTASHQDFAGVGIAVPDSLQPWRVSQLKKMGCNAWRTAHNPPSAELLDACDRLGMMVMDENRHLGDSHLAKSPKGTTCTNFSDLDAMILRDRNHPSIIMWSMCNEEGLQGTAEGAQLFSTMADEVRRYDRTRPITSAMNAGLQATQCIANVEDIIGINYNETKYDAIHQKHPGKSMFGSETANDKTTRGEYVTDRTNGWITCYNLCEHAWLPVVNKPFMAGSFTWTGFDYKGEPNPYGWPDISNNTGLMDVCGFPKDKYYYLESCWSDAPMVHLMPGNWNHPVTNGQPVRVIAFSNARDVELFLNGNSLGSKAMPHDGHVEWQVPFQPGQLVAKASREGRVVATDTLETTGPPERIEVIAARAVLLADGQDAVVAAVSVLDAKGRVDPDASNRIYFHLTGGGKILGVGNGNPADHDPDKAERRNAFHGHCIAVIQAGSKPVALRLDVMSPGLKSARMDFRVR